MDWKEIKYKEIFDEICNQIDFRKIEDANFTVEDAKKMLNDAMVDWGNDWAGRGGISDIVHEATVAAYEFKISEWYKDPGA